MLDGGQDLSGAGSVDVCEALSVRQSHQYERTIQGRSSGVRQTQNLQLDMRSFGKDDETVELCGHDVVVSDLAL